VCEDHDPKVAQQMTAYFGDIGNTVFRRISSTTAGEERRFLEKRWEKAKEDVVAASMRLQEFEEQHKLVDLSEQSKAMVSAMASLKAELLAKQIQLSYLNQFSSPDEATAVQLRRQIAIIQSKLDSMMQDRGAATDGDAGPPATAKSSRSDRSAGRDAAGLFPEAMRVPKLKFELEGLTREKKIQETLFLMLTQRYEMARISEARDTSAFQILDAPVIADRRSRPKRSVVVAEALFIGLLLGVSVSFVRRWRTGSRGIAAQLRSA
jgi:capsule polysaccharide export protein KpsE/RkpR